MRVSSSPTTSTTRGVPAAASACYEEIRTLQPGVTEIHVQPAIDTPEVRALTPAADGWIDDYVLMTNDSKLEQLLSSSGATLIGYRRLRDVMRAA